MSIATVKGWESIVQDLCGGTDGNNGKESRRLNRRKKKN